MSDDDEIVSKFSIKKLKDIETKPGCWSYSLIGVFEEDNQIGEFTYNYRGTPAFQSFLDKKTGKWFALYCENYMWSSLMSLPDCKKIWTEEGGEYKDHFCPVDYHVPQVCVRQNMSTDDPYPYLPNWDPDRWAKKESQYGGTSYVWPKEGDENYKEYEEAKQKSKEEYDSWDERHPFDFQYAPFGFVSGCKWGDDTSHKIEFINLVDVYNPKRDARFGYIELPREVELKNAIDLRHVEDITNWEKAYIEIATPKLFFLSGKSVKEN